MTCCELKSFAVSKTAGLSGSTEAALLFPPFSLTVSVKTATGRLIHQPKVTAMTSCPSGVRQDVELRPFNSMCLFLLFDCRNIEQKTNNFTDRVYFLLLLCVFTVFSQTHLLTVVVVTPFNKDMNFNELGASGWLRRLRSAPIVVPSVVPPEI